MAAASTGPLSTSNASASTGFGLTSFADAAPQQKFSRAPSLSSAALPSTANVPTSRHPQSSSLAGPSKVVESAPISAFVGAPSGSSQDNPSSAFYQAPASVLSSASSPTLTDASPAASVSAFSPKEASSLLTAEASYPNAASNQFPFVLPESGTLLKI